VYTDPSGEFVFTAACLLIPGAQPLLPYAAAMDFAAMSNVLLNLGNIDNGWDALKYFGVGAGTGLIGAGVGMGVNASLKGQPFMEGVLLKANVINTGFASGFVSGAAGGFTSGFITGFGNEAIQGGDAFDMLASGWSYGWKGAIGGAVMGGIMGGIDAVRHDRHFITGAKKQQTILKINKIGKGEVISFKDFDTKNYGGKENYYTAVNKSNPNINIDYSEHKVDIIIPRKTRINKITAVKDVTDTPILYININKRSINYTYLPIDNKPNNVIIHGWRWRSNSISSIGDLFHWRKFF